MSKGTKVGLIAVLTLFLFVFAGWCANDAQAGRDSEPGVRIIKVSKDSRYILDDRFDLCFYETKSSYVPNVIQVDCNKFKGK